MTKKAAAKTLRRIVKNSQDDSLERAESAFREYTDAQLDSEYSMSGRTCREILEGYREARARWAEAQALLEEMLRTESTLSGEEL